MNKLKKPIAMLLAIVMVMSGSPLALALTNPDGTAYAEGTDYTYGDSTFENPNEIFFDTTGTTETIRLAAAKDSFTYGNKVVAATKSGVPYTAGSFKDYLYAGETPEMPKVEMIVYGISASSEIQGLSNPTVDSSVMNGYTWQTADPSTGTADLDGDGTNETDYVKFVWTMAESCAGSATVSDGPDTNIVYTITFQYNNKTYSVHAYSHTEYILHPSGVDFYGYCSRTILWSTTKYSRASVMGTLVSDQMKPSFGDSSSTSGYTRCYINGSFSASENTASASVLGMNDSGATTTTAFLMYDSSHSEYNSVIFAGGSTATSSSYNFDLFGYGENNGNRTLPTVWIDKADDHLGTGTNGNLTNGLNMRLTFKVGEQDAFGSMYIYRFSLFTDPNWSSGQYSGTDVTAINSDQWVAESGKSAHGSGIPANGLVHSTTTGEGTYLNSSDILNNGSLGWMQIKMSGIGPTESQTSNTDSWGYVWMYKVAKDTTSPTSEPTSNIHTGGAWGSVRFRVYTTEVLRAVLNAIDRGDLSTNSWTIGNQYGSTFGQKTVTLTSTKGVAPQEFMYASGWSNFLEKYDAAREILAAFDAGTTGHSYTGYSALSAGTEQYNVDKAVDDLVTAYNALSYQSKGAVVVHHYKVGTTEQVAPDEIFYGLDASGNPTKNASSVATYFKNGVTFTLKSLTYIKGFQVSGVSSVEGYAKFTYNGTEYGARTLYDKTGASIGDDYIFYYEASDQSLLIHTNSDYNGTGLYIGTVKTFAQPDFSTIKTTIGTKAHYNYAGMYDNADLTGTAINESTWTMPNVSQNLWIAWTPKNVKVHVNGIDNSGNAVTLTSGEYGTEVAPTTNDEGNLSVTLAKPEDPTGTEGNTFVEFYADSACTTAIEWPITADYTDESEYTITEGDTVNTVEIYAKFVNLNNKLFYETQGGTLPDGYTEEYSFTVGETMPYPTPTRAGYTFDGWATKNDDGTYTSIAEGYVLSSATGFTVYAQWTANQITVQFNLGIPAGEVSTFNSPNVYATIAARADQTAVASDAPTTIPRRYGFVFNFWSYENKKFTFDGKSKYPAVDAGETVVLEAKWKDANDVAFADLTSYVKNAGTNYVVDEQHTRERQAAAGDTVSIQFKVRGNFYTGSQSYIFGYDRDFFETISGVDVFVLNENNSYISTTKAEATTITTFNSTVQSEFTNTDPYQNITVNAGYIQVAIDPDVYSSGCYNTVSLNDDAYLVEIKLKVKDSATGMGSVWLATETLRTSDNLMGDTFVSYSKDASSLAGVSTDRVTFDTDVICTTIDLTEETPETTTITTALPTDSEGNVLGVYADGTTANKTYTGRDGAEILETYTDTDGNSAYGFPTPTRTGYTISGWTNIADSSDKWIEGYYATTAQSGNTYQAEWTPNSYKLRFYDYTEGTEYTSVDVVYDQVGVTGYPDLLSNLMITYYGFIPVGEEDDPANVVDFTTYHVTGDAEFYVCRRNAQKTVTINAYVGDGDASTKKGAIVLDANVQAVLTAKYKETYNIADSTIRYDETLKIVSAMPAESEREAGTVYVLSEDIDTLMNTGTISYTAADGTVYSATLSTTGLKGFTSSSDKNHYEMITDQLPVSLTLAASSSSNYIDLTYQGKIVTDVFNAYYATYNTSSTATEAVAATYTGSYTTETAEEVIDEDTDTKINVVTWSITGRYGTTYDFAAATAGVQAPYGYTLNKWSSTSTQGTFSDKTYTASYTAVSVSVNFLADDGTTVSTTVSKSYATGNITAANFRSYGTKVAKDGYTFKCWNVATKAEGATVYTSADATALLTSAKYMSTFRDYISVADDGTYSLYFVPVYTANTYNVIYKITLEGTTSEDATLAQTATFNSTYNLNSYAADVPGYTFSGWYADEACTGTPAAAGTEETLTTTGATWYGKYTPNNYTVTFDANGGSYASGDGTKTVTYNTDITEISPLPTWAGHTLLGWSTNASATTPDTATTGSAVVGHLTTADNTVTYYAIWEAQDVPYTIEYYYEQLDGTYVIDSALTDTTKVGTVSTTQTVSQSDIESAAHLKTGFTYSAADSTISGTVPETGTLVLKVYYSRNSYTFKAVVDGVETVSKSYKYEEAVETPATPTKEGYEFSNWTPAVPETMPAENYTVTAAWTVESFSIAFDITEGTGTAPATITENYNTAITLPDTTGFHRTGYTFTGWADKDGNKVEWTTMPDNGATGTTVTLYAQWAINSYSLTFVLDNGEDDVVYSAENGNAVVYDSVYNSLVPTGITKTGYTFDGWAPSLDTSVDNKMPAYDVTYTAQWKANTYTIRYVYDNGDEDYTEDYAYGTAITPVENPTKTGYTFTGWSPAVPAAMPLDGITVTAQWQINAYDLTFVLDNGSADVAYTAANGNAVNYDTVLGSLVPTGVTKTGYSFAGWLYNGKTYTAEEAAAMNMPASAATFTAQWTVDKFDTVFYNGEDDTTGVYRTVSTNFGEAVSYPDAPTKDGYDFAGWTPTAITSKKAETEKVYANWTKHNYTLTYSWNGATTLLDQQTTVNVAYADTITLPVMNVNFSYTGRTFTGWYTDEGLTDRINTADYVIPAQAENGNNITLYAGFTVNEYQITFDSDGGSEVAAKTGLHYGDEISAPEEPTKAGYDFGGWKLADGTVFTAWTTMPAENIELTAIWTAHVYDVAFVEPDYSYGAQTFDNMTVYDDGTTVWAVSGTYNAQLTSVPAAYPAVQNYTFIGWSTDGTKSTLITDIAAWTVPAAAKDATIYLYPVYERVTVELEIESTSGAEIVDQDKSVTPAAGYIYNVGVKQKLADVQDQLQVKGDGTLTITPTQKTSKMSVCGTGSKVELKDNVTSEVVERYYIIVFGDVTGDAQCNALDLDIIYEQVAISDPALRTWSVSADKLTSDLNGCYNRAADTDGDGDADDIDAANIEGVVLGCLTYEYFSDDDQKYYRVKSI